MRLTALIVLLTSFSSVAQTIEESYLMAEKFFSAHNFSAASATYNRVVYFSENDEQKQKCYLKIAECYLEINKPNKAFKALDAAIILTQNTTAKNDIILYKSLKLTEAKYWFKAQEELYSVKNTTTAQEELKNYLLAVALFGASEYDASKSYFLKITEKQDSASIEAIFKKSKRKLNPKRAVIARYLSLGVPGLGQFASGNVKGGINSMLLVGGLAYLYYNTIQEYGIFSGLITVFPWVSRYHLGGSENAETSMLKRQKKLKSRYFDELISISID